MGISKRPPLSTEHARLGQALREIRHAARKSTREIPGYSSGHISNVENGHVTPSRDLVKIYASLGGDLATLEGALRGIAEMSRAEVERSRAAARTLPTTISADSPVDEIRANYRLEESGYRVRYDGRGVMKECLITNTVRPVAELLQFVNFGSAYLADRRRGVLHIETIAGCSIARRHENESGAVEVVLELEEPASDSNHQTHYALRLTVKSDERAQPLLRDYVKLPRRRHSFEVHFEGLAVPREVWNFRSTYLVDELRDPDPQRVILPSSEGIFACSFSDIAGEFIGMAWRWPN